MRSIKFLTSPNCSNSSVIYAIKIFPNFIYSTMKGAVILVGVILLFHNILVTAWRTFVINDATEQVWEVVSVSRTLCGKLN